MKVQEAFAHQSQRSVRLRPSLTPKTGARASSAAEAMAKRSATPVNGGNPRRPTRMTAQVVPQIRISAARDAQVRNRPGFGVPTLLGGTSGIDLVQHPRIRNGLPQVRQAGHPGHEPLDAHAEAAVGERPVFTDVKIPLERLDGEVVLLDAREQQVVVVNPLAAADDLAVALGRQQVETQHGLRILRVGLHVEGLERCREAGHHHRLVELAGEDGLLVAAEVVAPLDRVALAVEDRDRLGVGDAREGRHHFLQFGGVALQHLEVLPRAVEDARGEVAHELLGEGAEPLELQEGHLGLHHPELHQVAAGLGLLGAEGGAEAIDLAEGGGGGLQVELAALREVGLVAEVVGLEQVRGPLAGGGREDGRVDERELPLVEEVADALLDLAAYPQGGALPAGAQPEVTVLHEERRAVLFGGDGIVLGEAQDLEAARLDLDADRGALVLLDGAAHPDGGLLGDALDVRPGLFGDVLAAGHGLHDAAGGAHLEEGDLAAGALIVDPSRQLDLLADVLGQLTNRGDGSGGCLAHGGGIVLYFSGKSGSLERASAAARCSAIFLLGPSPVPPSSPASQHSTTKILLWSGPEAAVSRYSGRSQPNAWETSWSWVLESVSSLLARS